MQPAVRAERRQQSWLDQHLQLVMLCVGIATIALLMAALASTRTNQPAIPDAPSAPATVDYPYAEELYATHAAVAEQGDPDAVPAAAPYEVALSHASFGAEEYRAWVMDRLTRTQVARSLPWRSDSAAVAQRIDSHIAFLQTELEWASRQAD